MRKSVFIFTIFIFAACSQSPNPYEVSSTQEIAAFRKVVLPFKSGTSFFVHNGAFGKPPHNEKGFEYRWDMDAPYGTEVLSIESGRVIDVWVPSGGGGCDKRYAAAAHNIKILHSDGTVAQYTHVKSLVKMGQIVAAGDAVAITAENGWVCNPHLDLAVFQSVDTLPNSKKPKTIPLYFNNIKDGILREGQSYQVP